ncbi:DUF5794 domain-containing protein [Halocatena salina]|uniref:DUF5794 domain-containing protein n=1 Tax=Halocatena salina TaxID=2934340 RepID=A0A8T9ZZC8_9EURY|nr:DUF5794 domain-containing protein [Halocatena salina]UPM42104.1 DUF5794 domain-containing protein [Halocatena salina]
MSTSRHPIALRLERHVGPGTRLLTTVLALPLVDGIFPALVIAGAVNTIPGILEVGLLVFGGSATLSVVLAEMDGTRREQVTSILLVGTGIIILAAVEAALAPTIKSLLVLKTFERFAALVILAIAAKTASATVGEYLPSPGVIIGLGLLASLDPGNAELMFTTDTMLIARSVAAAVVGVGFTLGVALAGNTLRKHVSLDYFRFGSAVALGVLSLSVLGVISDQIPLALAVLGVTALFSLDPNAEQEVIQPIKNDIDENTETPDGRGPDPGTGSKPDAETEPERPSEPDAPWI